MKTGMLHNYYPSLILAIEPQNQKYLATQLLKPFIFSHPVVLVGGFADVDAMWQWNPPVSPSPSSLSSFSSLLSLSSFSSLLYRQPSAIPVIAVAAALNPGPDSVARRPPLPFP